MKAIYNHILYTVVNDDGDGVFLADGLHVPFSSPNLIVEPTDEELVGLPAPYPVYTQHQDKLKPGLYLALFHGSQGLDRTTREKRFDDWGFNGPVIGPLEWVHTTYRYHIKFRFVSEEDAERYRPWLNDGKVWMGQDQELFVGTGSLDADCIIFAGDLFGDWTVFNHPKPS